MASKSTVFETGHLEMIHDAQLDYYGKRLATASSDRTIKLFDIVNDQQTQVADLRGHDGPVWQVSWAHPKFGNLLASCSYDARVIVWKEVSQNQWTKVFEHMAEASVNSLSWAPHTFGLILAAACADGNVHVFTHTENNAWDKKTFPAHKGGVNSVSWGPDMKTGAILANADNINSAKFARRFVTGGCDNRVKIWMFAGEEQKWVEQEVFANGENRHMDWVRDVSWAPSLGLPSNTIATCSEDKSVMIWTEDQSGMWRKAHVLKFSQKVWKVSWSIMGNILAVCQGDNKVSLWKESVDGQWLNLSEINERGDQQEAPQQ